MSNRERSHADLLRLMFQPGVIDIVVALHDSDGQTTISELMAAGITRPATPLRTLASAGQIARPDGGSWDDNLPPDTLVALTKRGRGLAEGLLAAGRWRQQHLPPPTNSRWPGRLHWITRLRSRYLS